MNVVWYSPEWVCLFFTVGFSCRKERAGFLGSFATLRTRVTDDAPVFLLGLDQIGYR